MRKMGILLLTMLFVFGVVGCGGAGKAEENPAPSKEEQKANSSQSKILVAYFSVTGHTKALAETTAKALGADIYEIRPEKPYTSNDLNYNDETTRATVEQKNNQARPALADKNANIGAYETVIIAHPIWWGQEPRIIDTFVESYVFTGKNITNICTSGGSDIGTTTESLQKLTKGKANWKQGKLFTPQSSESEIKTWFSGLGI
ncbi:Flavodoxin [Anaerovibrio sp. JC8]|uniref:flavodoxin n=1 Tax=Anaerovibrio sp. JC8 TaxID=1240085 RepID=UPI000A0AF516|nr:flavodoxin [Anaerovibrio sp. JC8]ORU00100.1 Flavodoxin [Anaerovibrio sp. JC8]